MIPLELPEAIAFPDALTAVDVAEDDGDKLDEDAARDEVAAIDTIDEDEEELAGADEAATAAAAAATAAARLSSLASAAEVI